MTLAAVVQAPEAELSARVLEDRRVGRALVVGTVDGAVVEVVEGRAALVRDAVANPGPVEEIADIERPSVVKAGAPS